MMKLVYVAGAFSASTRAGVEQNIAHAEEWGIRVAQIGAMPIVPHANTSHRDYELIQPYPFWIEGTKELLRRCDAVLLIPGWEKSSGARGEREEALRLVIPVFEELSLLRMWLDLFREEGAA